MRLIAMKPCSFDGKDYFIGDEIPEESVLNPKLQEGLGVIAIANSGEDKVSGEKPDADYLPEVKETDSKVDEALAKEEAESKTGEALAKRDISQRRTKRKTRDKAREKLEAGAGDE